MKNKLLGLLFGTLLAGTAFAHPIADGSLIAHKSGWYPSVNTACPRVCAAVGAKAEGEAFNNPSLGNTATYVCKGVTSTAAPSAGKGFLYGNNFNAANYAPFCFVSTLSAQVQRLQKFYCLCVQ